MTNWPSDLTYPTKLYHLITNRLIDQPISYTTHRLWWVHWVYLHFDNFDISICPYDHMTIGTLIVIICVQVNFRLWTSGPCICFRGRTRYGVRCSVFTWCSDFWCSLFDLMEPIHSLFGWSRAYSSSLSDTHPKCLTRLQSMLSAFSQIDRHCDIEYSHWHWGIQINTFMNWYLALLTWHWVWNWTLSLLQ